MRLLLTAPCLWFLSLAATPNAHDDDHTHDLSLKDVLHRIVRASRERFSPQKTFRVEMHPKRDYWYEVESSLPGATTCRIYEHPELIYQCEWFKDKRTPNPPSFSQLAHNVEAALGEKWTRSEPKSGRLVIFEPKDPTREGVIDLKSHNTSSRRLELTIHRPFDRPVPAPIQIP